MCYYTKDIFEIIIEEKPENWIIKKEILKLFNMCQNGISKIFRNQILRNLNDIYL